MAGAEHENRKIYVRREGLDDNAVLDMVACDDGVDHRDAHAMRHHVADGRKLFGFEQIFSVDPFGIKDRIDTFAQAIMMR